MIQIEFSPQEQEELHKQRYAHPHPRVCQRMEVLWLKSQGLAHKEIQRLAQVSSTTVTDYLKRYQTGGIEALKRVDFYRPQSSLEAYREPLKSHFEKHPPTRIAQAMVEIEQLTGMRLQREAVRVFLHRLGLSVRKVGMMPAKADPQVQEVFKKKELEPRLKQAQAGERAVFFVDAAHFVLAPFLGFFWCFTRWLIRAPSGRQRYNVLGALNAITHQLVTVTNTTYINAQSVCELLDRLKALALDVPITLIMDNARYQRCQLVMDHAKTLGIELLFLPPYSPNLNIIERLWKFVRTQCLYCKYYNTFSEFSSAIQACLDQTHSTHKKALQSLLTLKFQTLKNSKVMGG